MEFRPDKNGRDSFFIVKFRIIIKKDKGGIDHGN